ncbi:DUF2483 family protein [Staphylococcus hominis]|uniref:DUF2483 family protein n=1 Tax=Staphylococcus hominis TaxID=1290 RepID=UPI001F15BF6C|nr:DUF2483 family protein [Staphylococcus hominis]MCE4976585.1 DUF2483 family protein [Staphylococcus hominis]
MKETVTYIIKRKDNDLYITNTPSHNLPEIKYSTEFRNAKEFNGVDRSSIDMTEHKAIKHTHIEQDIYEEIEYDD